MRNKTFISSMFLSVACVSAANAGVVDPFTTPQTDVDAASAPFVSITGGLFNQRQLACSGPGSGSPGSGSIGSTFANFVPRGIISMTYQQAGGSTIDLSGIASMSFDLTRGASSLRIGWNFFDATGLPSLLELINPSAGTITTSATDPARVTAAGFNWGSIMQMEMQFYGGTSESTASGLSNFNYTAVPAPGALALLGVAGLVGARRRRA